METGNITTNTLNVSHANIIKDNQEDSHIAGSHALCVFINTVSMLWVCAFCWLTVMTMSFCIDKMRISLDETADKYRDVKKSAKTFTRVWSFINFVILWLNIPVIIYCHIGSRNCFLYSKTTGAGLMLFFCAVITYVIQLHETIFLHRWKDSQSGDVLITAPVTMLHQHPLQLIYWEKPVFKWTAKCYHTIGEDDMVTTSTTHTEVISCSTKISSL